MTWNIESYLEESRRETLQELEERVQDPRIVAAFREVPRSLFVPEPMAMHAYEDRALPIGEGQTISQPTMIAIMLEALAPKPEDRVLEVGGGSGYAAALLSRLVREVHTVELIPALVENAKKSLARAGIENVHVHVGDGTLGLPGLSPFDGILVSAAARHVPDELIRELAPGGRIVVPVGGPEGQLLRIGRRSPATGEMEWGRSVPCVFVPLVGS